MALLGYRLHGEGPEKVVVYNDWMGDCTSSGVTVSQLGLPLGVGHVRARTHDYIRHGTLFAALNYLDGKSSLERKGRKRFQEPFRFQDRLLQTITII